MLQFSISNYQCSMNEQLAMSNVAAFHSTSLIANILPIAHRASRNNSEGVA
jgi:hypothetical protein